MVMLIRSYLVIEKLFLELCECIVGTIIIQVQWVKHILQHSTVLSLQNMISENPWHRHLNRELK